MAGALAFERRGTEVLAQSQRIKTDNKSIKVELELEINEELENKIDSMVIQAELDKDLNMT